MANYGQPAKGKGRRDTPSTVPHGRVITQTVRLVSVPVRDAETLGTRLMHALGVRYLTQSPASNGNGGNVTLNTGAGIVGRDPRRTGALQEWRTAGAPVARDNRRAKVGIRGGPASMPAFPSTGNGQTFSLVNPLTGMDTPFAIRNPGVG